MREGVTLYDTTLRDGAQTQGVDFSVEDKRIIAEALDRIGIHYIEGGWPGANPTDDAFFADPPALKRARFTAFGMTKRSGRSAANDPGPRGAAFVAGARIMSGRQKLGLPGRCRAWNSARRKPRQHRGIHRGRRADAGSAF